MDCIKTELSKFLGAENVFDDPETLALYTGDKSFARAIPPKCVVRVMSGEQAERLVKWANETDTPLIPVSSGAPHYRGDTAPSVPEAVIVDLSGMKKILSINKQHRIAVIEPGVTYGELQAALSEQDMHIAPCLAAKANKSVVASCLELDPRLNCNHSWAFTEPLRCVEVTWGSGDRMWTGEAAGGPMDLKLQQSQEKWQVEPVGPFMLDYFRLLTAAQGTMGIVTWASVRVELAEEAKADFIVPSAKLDDVLEFMYKTIHNRFSDGLFIMNGLQLAALTGCCPDSIKAIRADAPAWSAIVHCVGRDLLPRERCEQQSLDIADIAQSCALHMDPAASGVSAEKAMKSAWSTSRPVSFKEAYKGAFQDILFATTIDKTKEFVAKMNELAKFVGFPVDDIGVYIQPLHMGSAYHTEFTLYYDPCNKREVEKAKELFKLAGETFAAIGAYFYRPYGEWARLQLGRDAMGAKTLATLKGIYDPNGILNPGKITI